jgi:hypothetical protein
MADEQYANKIAPPGQVWVCGACGKKSNDLYGNAADYGWDVSCVLNAVLMVDTEKWRREPPPEVVK